MHGIEEHRKLVSFWRVCVYKLYFHYLTVVHNVNDISFGMYTHRYVCVCVYACVLLLLFFHLFILYFSFAVLFEYYIYLEQLHENAWTVNVMCDFQVHRITYTHTLHIFFFIVAALLCFIFYSISYIFLWISIVKVRNSGNGAEWNARYTNKYRELNCCYGQSFGFFSKFYVDTQSGSCI